MTDQKDPGNSDNPPIGHSDAAEAPAEASQAPSGKPAAAPQDAVVAPEVAQAPAEVAQAPAEATQPPAEASFAELFEASLRAAPPARQEVGDEVTGTILQIGDEWTFLDIGGKGEARMATAELTDRQGKPFARVGDRVEARVLRQDGEGTILSRVVQGGAGGRRVLEDAQAMELPVEGVVQKVVKGGLEVTVAGVRAFCPASQVSLRFVEDLTEFVGQRLTFRVLEVRDGGRSVVLSRKALLAAERDRQAAETRKRLQVGARFEGVVTSVRDFGAFVDIGGIEGLLHISEISHGRVERVDDVLSEGQTVQVEVIRMEGDRISLSMRALQGDPWQEAAERFAEGTRILGRVSRVQPYGAFVELAPGVDGLLHVGTLDDPRITDARRVFEQGQQVEVEVVSLDVARKRVGLAPADRVETPGDRPKTPADPPEASSGAGTLRQDGPVDLSVGAVVTGKVERVEPYGVFVRLPGPRKTGGRRPRGLVPREEIPGARDAQDLRRRFAVGDPLRVQVIEPDEKGRMRLSIRALESAAERQQVRDYLGRSRPAGGKGEAGGEGGAGGKRGSLGTLGDLLKGKL